MPRLSDDDVARYQRDGFVSPYRAMPESEALRYRGLLEDFEAEQGGPLTAIDGNFRYKSHLLLPWAAELIRLPEVLDAVESVIGPDILCWTSTWFIKEPQSPAVTIWHQDATYFGLRPHKHVSAWVSLAEASMESGCMEFVPGTSDLGLIRHVAQASPNSINGGAQRTERDFDDAETVATPLKPGEFSLHHTLCVHRSQPNDSNDRRIGLGISYIPADVRHIGSDRMSATLVRGEDRYGNFDLEPAPGSDMSLNNTVHAGHYKTYRAGYNEQVEWHKEGRWN